MSADTSQKREIHVLTLTPFYPSEEDGSGGCFVSEPLEWLSELGIRNTVIAAQPFYRKKLRALASQIPAQWQRYFALPRGFGLPTAGAFLFARIVGQIRELQRSNRIDLIHAHGALPCGHAAMLVSEELQIPYVVSVHGLDAFSTEQVTGRAGAWCRRISQRVYRSSRRAICISEHVRERVLEGTGPGCRTSVVYNGVNPEFFSTGEQEARGKPVILSVGNLIPTKGHAVLIRAIASIAAEFPSAVVEIIGDGVEHASLVALAKELGIAERVSLLRRQPREQIADAMRRCAIFALPSRHEGLGCVYLEAMSTCKPVIGCRGQGISEIIRQASNGFLVGPDNYKELALVLGMLLRDEGKRRNLGRAARDTILDRFTLQQQAENLARIYREAAQ